ncbi:putative peptide-methionine (S)-S-oxide reductase [Lupinus albus]|uniref:Peptide methionine sulfoxide reductase A5 n=1 Tax=Lupinus albus TaxID=3870 RepID=A0A6A4QK83_LUPAL|nr:putative peptide-methionine (S)-S-oxide reductase [Lupinus albus]
MMGVSESKLHLHLHLPLFIFVIVFSFDNALCIRFPDRVHPSDHHHQRFNTAVFALGSFWRSEAVFGCLPGVIRTTVGYAGGSKHNPRYRTFGDHAESVQVQYDPGMTSFKELLDIFWSCHDPRQVYGQGPDVGNQYRSIIFVNGTEESRIASVSKEQEQARSRSSIVTTQILQLGTFYPAEPEHQKFELKKNSFLIKLIGNLHEEELERSSLATKLNGYVAELCPPNIQKHIDAKINEIVKKGWPILREL